MWKAAVAFELLPDGCAYKRARGGEAAWTTTELLLVHILNAVQTANWQRGGDKSPSKRPKVLEAPAAMDAEEKKQGELITRAERHTARRAAREAAQARANAEEQPSPVTT